jgi:hypothetical protein
LDIEAVADLRPGAINDLRQMQCSRGGPSVRFLSPRDGRAAAANALISAGIGAGLVPRFARLVSMPPLDPPNDCIVPDARFTHGGGSCAAGKTDAADPVEPRAHPGPSDSEAPARDMLDVSEQAGLPRSRLALRSRFPAFRSRSAGPF